MIKLVIACWMSALFIAGVLTGQPGDLVHADFGSQNNLPVSSASAEQAPTGAASAGALTPQVSAGIMHTCALKADGSIICWGWNYYGQTNAPAGTDYTQVSAGWDHTCAVKTDGSLICWGWNNDKQSSAPLGTDYTQVSAGGLHTCAQKVDGSLICWGQNDLGQSSAPEGTYTQVSAGPFHTCAVKMGGSLICWGQNNDGQTNAPVDTGYTQVSAGRNHTCALKADGSLICWGLNDLGQSSAPAGTYTQVSAGADYTCAVKTDGSLICWGQNNDGQTNAPAGTGYTQVSAWGYHSCALKADGSLICWGRNNVGQAPVITLAPTSPGLPDGRYQLPYSQTFSAGGGTQASPTYTYEIISGALPGGLSLSTDGTLNGAPTEAGAFTFTVRARDNNLYYGTRMYSLTVAKATPTASLSVSNSPVPYNRAPQAAVVNTTSSVPGTLSNVRYNSSTTQPTSIGTYTIIADFTPNDSANYNPLTNLSAGTFTITKAELTVSANPLSKPMGASQPIPVLSYTISGYVNGEGVSVLSGVPELTTTATAASPIGDYPITISLGTLAADNYTFVFVPAKLTITGSKTFLPTIRNNSTLP